MNLIEALQAMKEGKKVKLIKEKTYLEMCSNGTVKIKSLKGEEIGYWGLYNVNLKTNDFELYEEPKSILDAKEKSYLEGVLRPFKDKIKFIKKTDNFTSDKEMICIYYTEENYSWNLPPFEIYSMYKNMEFNKRYTLQELGLFDRKIY